MAEINGRDLRWLLEAIMRTKEPEFAEHRGYARAKLDTLGNVRGRKPGQKNRPKKRR